MKCFCKPLLLYLLVCTPLLVLGQLPSANTLTTPTTPTNMFVANANPLHPFGIFLLNAPLYVGNYQQKKSTLSIGYTMANVWNPPATMYYPQQLTAQQRQEVNGLDAEKRPQYFSQNNIPTQQKQFAADGVLQNMAITYVWERAQHGTFIFTANTYILSGGGFPLHYPVSDNFIEQFHSAFAVEDNFSRKQFPYNNAVIEFTDEDNTNIKIVQGTVFTGTLDVHYYYPVYQQHTPKSYHTLQVGAHTAIPLNGYYPKISGGVSATFMYQLQFTPRWSANVVLNGMFTNNTLVTLGSNVPNITDNSLRKHAKLYIGTNFYKAANHRTFYIGLLNNYQDALLKGSIFSRSQDKFKDLGVSYLQTGDQWQGHTVESSFKLNKLTPASMYFLSLKTYLLIGRKTNIGDFCFSVGEDLLSVNNAPDLQYTFSYAFNLH